MLARKDRASEITMDDLTAELRLRGLEPPYDAVKQGLATRFAGIDEATQRKAGSGKLEANSGEKLACSSVRATRRSTEPAYPMSCRKRDKQSGPKQF
jgi:hypothetical protein